MCSAAWRVTTNCGACWSPNLLLTPHPNLYLLFLRSPGVFIRRGCCHVAAAHDAKNRGTAPERVCFTSKILRSDLLHGALLIRLPPGEHREQHRFQATAEIGQRVFHARWHFSIYRTNDDTITF
jgi:hypothetical protein